MYSFLFDIVSYHLFILDPHSSSKQRMSRDSITPMSKKSTVMTSLLYSNRLCFMFFCCCFFFFLFG